MASPGNQHCVQFYRQTFVPYSESCLLTAAQGVVNFARNEVATPTPDPLRHAPSHP